MVFALISVAATVPDWITAISTAIIALGVMTAALGWIRRQSRELLDPGEAPGPRGELRETIEDVLMETSTPSECRQFRKEIREEQKSQSRKARWQRKLRQRNRSREIRKHKKTTQPNQEVKGVLPAPPENSEDGQP